MFITHFGWKRMPSPITYLLHIKLGLLSQSISCSLQGYSPVTLIQPTPTFTKEKQEKELRHFFCCLLSVWELGFDSWDYKSTQLIPRHPRLLTPKDSIKESKGFSKSLKVYNKRGAVQGTCPFVFSLKK